MGRKKTILTLINEAETSDHKVTVLPLMCGAGKSSTISQKIAECIRRRSGLIIVTDRTERFDQYLSPDDNKLKETIEKNKSKILDYVSQPDLWNTPIEKSNEKKEFELV